MTKPNTLNSDNNVKRVHDSTLNPSFGWDSHVQQVTSGRHPATARTQQLIACWNVRTLYQKGKLDNVVQEMDRMKINNLGIAETRWQGTNSIKQ